MKNLKIFLTIFLVATLLIVVSTVSYATEGPSFNFIKDEGNNNTTNNTTNNTVFNNITANNTTNNATNNTVNNTVNNTTNNTANNTNNSTYNNTDLPKAGSGDSIAIFVIIAVFGISALYAFKKIREYNVR